MSKKKWTYGKIVLSQIAKQDLKDIFNFIKRNSQHYAKLENMKIQEAIEQLPNQPMLGRMVPEQEDENLREMIFSNYRIIYLSINSNRIEILTIHHHARLLANNSALNTED